MADIKQKSEPRIQLKGAPKALRDARIMIIDDEQCNILVARRFLELEGYRRFISVTDSTVAVDQIVAEKPDLILLDIMMPIVSGLDILREIRQHEDTEHIPVLILTASDDAETKKNALMLRATDFLSKPVDPNDLIPRVKNVLQFKSYQDQLARHAEQLEALVKKRTAELALSREQVVHCLARAAEYRDNDTGQHITRVGKYVGIIGRYIGFPESRVEMVELAAQLHDVGKIGIPDSILLDKGKLDPEQYETMKKHCAVGVEILDSISAAQIEKLKTHARLGAQISFVPSSPLLMLASRIAQTHHEWWDGTGYPLGLKGEDIPIEGRMTAIADVFDALSSRRPYKEPFSREKCHEIMIERRGTHFDPELLDAFFDCGEEIVQVQLNFMDSP